MYREIIVPTAENHTIEIPEEFYGKEVQIIVENISKNPEEDKAARLKRIRSAIDGVRVDLSNFKFNRDEANNYEDD